MFTTSAGLYGTNGRRIRPFTSEKIAELTPIAMARVAMATAVKPGDLARARKA
jgi:hypothetical protein